MSILKYSVAAIILIISISGCSSDSKEKTSEEKANPTVEKKQETVEIEKKQKYSDLPVVKDLSFVSTPSGYIDTQICNIKSVFVDKITYNHKYRWKSYNGDKPMDNESKIKMNAQIEETLKTENFMKQSGVFYIFDNDYIYMNHRFYYDFNGIGEFDREPFKEQFKKEYIQLLSSKLDSCDKYPQHIRIKDLNFPVKYSKNYPKVAEVELLNEEDKNLFDNIVKVDLDKDIVKTFTNDFIGSHTNTSRKRMKYGIESFSWNKTIKAEASILNNIGKANKGTDAITEMTLSLSMQNGNFYYSVTSYKLASLPDKRIIVETHTLENADVEIKE